MNRQSNASILADAGLCGCPVPEEAEVEILEDGAYPSKTIVYTEDEDTLVPGGSVLPEGMFGLVAILKDPAAVADLRRVLARARHGPAKSR